ncbi:MAG: RHS repeat-associated core domain-containing protein [Rhodoferax sp.]|nr:RHS repeat-associated core domain-containing protein [Rhodoferax sp.]
MYAIGKAGNIVWAASFDAFGRASVTAPQATLDKPTITSNLRLPGQYEDLETGLHYNFRRHYDPEIGRYVSQDPIGVEGGLNLYAYANGGPLMYADPTGLMPLEGFIMPIISSFLLYKMFEKQALCQRACENTKGPGAVAACGSPDRQDVVDIAGIRRLGDCNARCAFISGIGQLLPKTRP